MRLPKVTPRVAPRSAAGSTATTIARDYTLWNYREGYVATTDPAVAVAGMVVAGVGLVVLVRSMQPPPRCPIIARSTPRCPRALELDEPGGARDRRR